MSINYRPTAAELWVSINGSDSNSGTRQSPLRTIQKALNEAEPGTSILVQRGVYDESVRVSGEYNQALKELTASRSIALISVDGEGAAQIIARAGKPAIELLSIKNLVIDGFRIVGDATANDAGPVKIVGGPTIYNGSGNVHIVDNIIAGKGVDGIKAVNTSGIHIEGNTFQGAFIEQAVDLVAVSASSMTNNLVIGSSDIGFAMKGGSRSIEVIGNHFDFHSFDGKGPAIKVGGEGFSRSLSETPVELRGFEAKDVLVSNNVVERSGAYAVMLQGARSSTVSNNFFDNGGDEAIRVSVSRSSYGFSDNGGNEISGNIIASGLDLIDLQPGASLGSTVFGNRAGSLADVGFEFGTDGGGSRPQAPASSGSVSIVVRAGGTGTDAAPPRFEVVADGVSLGSRAADPTSGAFNASNDALFDRFVFTTNKAPEAVEIIYGNDGATGGVNRDLVVDYIEVGGRRYESEADGDFVADSGNASLNGPAEKLYVNGTLSFDI